MDVVLFLKAMAIVVLIREIPRVQPTMREAKDGPITKEILNVIIVFRTPYLISRMQEKL